MARRREHGGPGRRRAVLPALLLAVALGLASGPAAADFAAGVTAYDRGDYARARDAWLPLARNGDPAAQRNIGHLYRFGLGVAQDFGKAVYWYREAAEAGLASAQANLGMMYLRGQGVAQDPKSAAYWFQTAAAQGYAVAQYNLGLLYLTGDGVARSEPRAMAWFYLAAKAGHRKALEALSKMVAASALQVGPPPPPGWKPPAAGAADATKQAAPAKQAKAATDETAPPSAPPSAPASEMASDGNGPDAAPDDGPSVDLVGAIAGLFSGADDGGATRPETHAAASTARQAPPAEARPKEAGAQPAAGKPDIAERGAVEFAGLGGEHPLPKGYVRQPGDQQQLTEAMVAFHAGDYEIARRRLLPLARAGMAEAQYRLGLLYTQADYVGRDRAEAFVWLTLAADRGHPEAGRARSRLMQQMSADERLRSHALLRARRGAT